MSNPSTMEETLRGHVSELITAYCEFTQRGSTQVARMMFGDAGYFLGVLGKRNATASFRVRTYDMIVARFGEHWPPALPWPEHIRRIAASDVPDMPDLRQRKRRSNSSANAGAAEPEAA